MSNVLIIQQVAIDTLALDSTVLDTFAFEIESTQNIPVRKIQAQKIIKTIDQPKVLFKPEFKHSINSTWPSIVLTTALLLLAFTKAFGANRFRQIYKSLFSYYSANEVVREEKVFFHQVNFSLFLVYLFTISLLLFFLSTHLNPSYDYPLLYLSILGMVTVAYFIKFISNAILGYLFDCSQYSPAYVYNVLLYNYLLGILLIPSLALIYFSNFQDLAILNLVILPLISIILLIRFIRFFAIGISNNISYLYIILYICTLEILPLVVLGKFLIH